MDSSINEQTIALKAAAERAGEFAGQYAFSVLGAIVILIIGFTLAGLISRWARKSLERVGAIDLTLATFLGNALRYLIWIITIVAVLNQFGVQTTSIIAVLGAAGLAIGLALQGTLSNIAAGLMLLILRPFKVGDFIEANSVLGTVEEIGLFTTQLKKPDGLFMMAPNSMIWNAAIINYSRNPARRFELVVGIGYEDDMAKARGEMLALAEAEPRVLTTPAPITFVGSLDDSSVGVTLWCWIATPDFMPTSRDLREAAKRRFDETGIEMPFPQREIRQRG